MSLLPDPGARQAPAPDVFAEIADIAAQVCDAAYSAITVEEGGRHRPLALHGRLALEALPRDSRFCCEVLHSGAPLEVSDAHFDLRFHDDPLVAGAPRIRFYSGVPLLDEGGSAFGTLSVFDEAPKVLAESQREALRKLADVVVRLRRDIEARRRAEETLSWQATHDVLTELGNRRHFEAELARHIEAARAGQCSHAVLFVDLDQFKVVNDTCGHAAGDALLRDLARLLAGKMRRGDCIARLGGDEFGLVLANCDLLRAQHVAAQILSTIRSFRFAWQGQVFNLGASIGIAPVSAESRDVTAVMGAADTACYIAKDKGRNQVQVYRDTDEEVSLRRGEMGWVSRLTRGLEDNRFHLHSQRVVALSERHRDGEYVELLLRLRDEHGRTALPSAFIPAAERYQLMPRIDRWVVEKALSCLGRMGPGGVHPRFGINLSGVSLGDPAFGDFVEERCEASRAAAGRVCFEITETAAIRNLAVAARFIERFRALGCRFALDDFGMGVSSFAYLRSLPVDYVKIDGSFVRGSGEDPVNAAVVDAIARLAKAVGAYTVAESVESRASLERMAALGVDFAQGHALHRPEPYADLAARMDYARALACSVHAA